MGRCPSRHQACEAVHVQKQLSAEVLTIFHTTFLPPVIVYKLTQSTWATQDTQVAAAPATSQPSYQEHVPRIATIQPTWSILAETSSHHNRQSHRILAILNVRLNRTSRSTIAAAQCNQSVVAPILPPTTTPSRVGTGSCLMGVVQLIRYRRAFGLGGKHASPSRCCW